jgi:hypothetical protein
LVVPSVGVGHALLNEPGALVIGLKGKRETSSMSIPAIASMPVFSKPWVRPPVPLKRSIAEILFKIDENDYDIQKEKESYVWDTSQ